MSPEDNTNVIKHVLNLFSETIDDEQEVSDNPALFTQQVFDSKGIKYDKRSFKKWARFCYKHRFSVGNIDYKGCPLIGFISDMQEKGRALLDDENEECCFKAILCDL